MNNKNSFPWPVSTFSMFLSLPKLLYNKNLRLWHFKRNLRKIAPSPLSRIFFKKIFPQHDKYQPSFLILGTILASRTGSLQSSLFFIFGGVETFMNENGFLTWNFIPPRLALEFLTLFSWFPSICCLLLGLHFKESLEAACFLLIFYIFLPAHVLLKPKLG